MLCRIFLYFGTFLTLQWNFEGLIETPSSTALCAPPPLGWTKPVCFLMVGKLENAEESHIETGKNPLRLATKPTKDWWRNMKKKKTFLRVLTSLAKNITFDELGRFWPPQLNKGLMQLNIKPTTIALSISANQCFAYSGTDSQATTAMFKALLAVITISNWG